MIMISLSRRRIVWTLMAALVSGSPIQQKLKGRVKTSPVVFGQNARSNCDPALHGIPQIMLLSEAKLDHHDCGGHCRCADHSGNEINNSLDCAEIRMLMRNEDSSQVDMKS
ncbi:hypothetical protein [Phyllobacterium pellucidum]|uniref:hypothetical protein n=1 Tax=Phyllobacterium pellucidum TaxID=2740464 RepID=UPI001D15C91D|nr:hypothetical protein [Phyllobacterium sp. T1018]UGY09142.1 hypothetical protein LLE51_014090 [Phyllobacterium sp. T1018]